MSKSNPLTVERCREVVDTFGKEFCEALMDKAADCLHSYLLMYPEPKGYAETWQMVHSLSDAVILFMVAEGYVTVAPEYIATEAERAERAEKQKQGPGVAELEQMLKGIGGKAQTPGSGAYL